MEVSDSSGTSQPLYGVIDCFEQFEECAEVESHIATETVIGRRPLSGRIDIGNFQRSPDRLRVVRRRSVQFLRGEGSLYCATINDHSADLPGFARLPEEPSEFDQALFTYWSAG